MKTSNLVKVRVLMILFFLIGHPIYQYSVEYSVSKSILLTNVISQENELLRNIKN